MKTKLFSTEYNDIYDEDIVDSYRRHIYRTQSKEYGYKSIDDVPWEIIDEWIITDIDRLWVYFSDKLDNVLDNPFIWKVKYNEYKVTENADRANRLLWDDAKETLVEDDDGELVVTNDERHTIVGRILSDIGFEIYDAYQRGRLDWLVEDECLDSRFSDDMYVEDLWEILWNEYTTLPNIAKKLNIK